MQPGPVRPQNAPAAFHLNQGKADSNADDRPEEHHLVQWIVARQQLDHHIVDRNAGHRDGYENNAQRWVVRGYAGGVGHNCEIIANWSVKKYDIARLTHHGE